ncbi:MAG: curli assembly protein CsgF [Balneolaceae bacterium]|nr:curli assembly protein CsgF [Balneolaceae bacterium]
MSCFAAMFLVLSTSSLAQQMVYRPTNPAFGGNPYNYQWMLSSANSQNLYKELGGYGYERDPLADFEESLQRQVLSQLTRNLVRDELGENLDLTKESTLEFGEFSINVTPGHDGVKIGIFNVLTGEETNITIPNING